MIRSVLTMQVREGREEEFRRVWESHAPRIAAHPGNRGQSFAVREGHARTFVITGDWADRQVLAAFESSPDRQALSAQLDPLCESASKTVLEIVVTVNAASQGAVA